MPRKSKHSDHILAAIRRYLTLHQYHLAEYLGVSPELVKHIEAGRREITAAMLLRVLPLAQLVPDHPAPEATEFNDTPTVAPDPGAVEERLRECLHKAGQLRRQMQPLARRTRFARRWQQVLPALLATAPANDNADDPQAVRARTWLLARQAEAAADLSPAHSAQWHLLRVRAEALEAEAAALIALLPQAPMWAQLPVKAL